MVTLRDVLREDIPFRYRPKRLDHLLINILFGSKYKRLPAKPVIMPLYFNFVGIYLSDP